jgi:phosphatidylglycerol---prolipoprotein diacylglyceryl transferase
MNYFTWDIDPVAFYIPFIQWPIRWYGIIFVTGLLLSYLFVLKNVRASFLQRGLEDYKEESITFIDTLFWYLIIGIIFGARLGHLIFYEDSFTFLEIFQTWKGGLASHGGVTGVLLAIFAFSYRNKAKYPEASLLKVMDSLVIPVCITGFFIRLGNFFNQEILGLATDLPWAVVFLNPFDGSAVMPRHPAQLYEGIYYLFHALVFYFFSTFFGKKMSGFKAGFLLSSFFIFRFLIEFIKEEQSALIEQSDLLNMGQILSLPVVLFGLLLMIFSQRKGNPKEIN